MVRLFRGSHPAILPARRSLIGSGAATEAGSKNALSRGSCGGRVQTLRGQFSLALIASGAATALGVRIQICGNLRCAWQVNAGGATTATTGRSACGSKRLDIRTGSRIVVVRPTRLIMKTSSIKDWLIDSVVIAGLTVVAIFFLPLLSACFDVVSLNLGRTLLWFHLLVLGDFLPHIIVGASLGTVTAWLVRHRKLSLAVLPSVFFSLYYFLYFSFGAEPYPWGRVFWLDSVIVGDWLLMVTASFICAGFVLRRLSYSHC